MVEVIDGVDVVVGGVVVVVVGAAVVGVVVDSADGSVVVAVPPGSPHAARPSTVTATARGERSRLNHAFGPIQVFTPTKRQGRPVGFPHLMRTRGAVRGPGKLALKSCR